MHSRPLTSSLGEVVTNIFRPVKGAAGGVGTLAGPKSTVTRTTQFVERGREDFDDEDEDKEEEDGEDEDDADENDDDDMDAVLSE